MKTAIGLIFYFFAAITLFLTFIFIFADDISSAVTIFFGIAGLFFIYVGKIITKAGIKINENLKAMELNEEKQTKNHEILIKYIDKDNKFTERNIVVQSIKKVTNDFIITAHCLLRNEKRTFKLSMIRVLVDNSSGKAVNNIQEFLGNLIINNESNAFQNYEESSTKPSREEIQKKEKEKINKEISKNELFKDGKIIHTMHENAIAFSPSGYIGIFTDKIKELKVLSINDIIKISFKRPPKDQWGDYDDCFECVLNVKDLHNPTINLSLYYDKDEAKEFYDEIVATYNVLKKLKR